jgi:hypothetical protein
MKMPIKELNNITNNNKFENDKINLSILNKYGFFIIRGLIPFNLINNYFLKYNEYKLSNFFDRNNSHLTEVRIGSSNSLINILYEDPIVKLAKSLFPKGAGVYNIRIVKKDNTDRNKVFLHQDVGYQYGSFNRYSIFIPLSNCYKENGGLTFVPGSHSFGYLGDAGAIRESILPIDLDLVTPNVRPGDVIIMNSYTWHKSDYNQTGEDRIYYDIHLNQWDDPSSKYQIKAGVKNKYEIDYDLEYIFDNSRLQRLNKYVDKYGKI